MLDFSKLPLIKVSDVPIGTPEGMRQVFASYYLQTQDKTSWGFGNIVSAFNPEQYVNAMDKFIVELQKSIEMIQEQKLGKKVIVQVLFFR